MTNAQINKIVFGKNSEFDPLTVSVESVVANGPDDCGDMVLKIKFEVTNNGMAAIGFLSARSQIFNVEGSIIGEIQDTYQQQILSNDTGQFEISICGLNSELFLEAVESSQIAVSVIGATGNKVSIFKGALSGNAWKPENISCAGIPIGLKFISGSFWEQKPDDDNDVYVESTVLLQNLTKDCYPVTKLYLEVTDKRGNTIDTSDNCQELPPGGVVSVSSLCSIQAKKLKGAKIELSLEAFKQCAIGFGMCNSIIVEQLVSDASEKLVDGAYLAYLSLSKVSIQFKFSPANGKYDSKRFTEVSIPVSLPVFIKHQLYGHPNYNVVVDYLYGGELIEEYDRELIDRGYEDQTSFLVVKNGNASIVYSVSNAEENWYTNLGERND